MSSQIPPSATAAAGRADASMLKRFGAWLKRVVTWPARLSFPGKIAFLSWVLLVLLALVVWLVVRSNPKHVALYHVLTWQRITVVLVLVFVIPLVIYYALKSWLVGERSLFPDIDYAWNAGLEALRENGMSIETIPLFLIAGSPDENRNDALAAASGRSFRVHGVPEGPAPFQWFANPDGAFLFLNQVGALSSLSALVEKHGTASYAEPTFAAYAEAEPAEPAAPAPAPAAPAAPPQTPQGGQRTNRGTLILDQPVAAAASPGRPMPSGSAFDNLARPSEASSGTQPSPAQRPALRGTLMFAEETQTAAPSPAQAALRKSTPIPPRRPGQPAPVALPAKDATLQRRRLHYLLRLIVRVREPLCPLNGVLTLLPFASIASSASEAQELERATRSDVSLIQRTARLRCPVTALVCGLEEERGFSELVRRVGRERAAAQRFGRGYDVRGIPTTEEMTAFSAHVVGAFEDWVYSLFREQDALARPGNMLLYGLLCKVRSTLKGRLTHILNGAFGFDPQRHSADEAFLFSGCYFAATGPTEDRQAFVRGVFDKLEDEQENVEWTAAALLGHLRRKRLAVAGAAVAGLLLLSLIALLVYKREA